MHWKLTAKNGWNSGFSGCSVPFHRAIWTVFTQQQDKPRCLSSSVPLVVMGKRRVEVSFNGYKISLHELLRDLTQVFCFRVTLNFHAWQFNFHSSVIYNNGVWWRCQMDDLNLRAHLHTNKRQNQWNHITNWLTTWYDFSIHLSGEIFRNWL